MGKKIISSLTLSALVLGLGFGLATAKPVQAVEGNSNTNTPITPAEVVTCIKAAIEKRDTAIKTSWDKYAASVSQAYANRKTALLAAWDMTPAQERRKALKAAWRAFKNARREARKLFNRERHDTWKTFGLERRACKAASDGMGDSHDLQPGHRD